MAAGAIKQSIYFLNGDLLNNMQSIAEISWNPRSRTDHIAGIRIAIYQLASYAKKTVLPGEYCPLQICVPACQVINFCCEMLNQKLLCLSSWSIALHIDRGIYLCRCIRAVQLFFEGVDLLGGASSWAWHVISWSFHCYPVQKLTGESIKLSFSFQHVL